MIDLAEGGTPIYDELRQEFFGLDLRGAGGEDAEIRATFSDLALNGTTRRENAQEVQDH